MPGSCNSSASPRRMRKASGSIAGLPSISTAAVCMSMRVLPVRLVIRAKRHCASAISQVAQAASRLQMLAREMDAIVDKGYVIIGSPDEVADRLRQGAKDLNVGHLMLLLQFGNMGQELAAYHTQLFAEKVMPQLTG